MQTQNPIEPVAHNATHKTTRRTISWTKLIATGAVAVTTFSALPASTQTAFAQFGEPQIGVLRQDVSLNTTVRGTISRLSDTRLNNTGYFEMRAEAGETLRVLVSQDMRFLMESRSFLANARIEIEGARDGDAFIARDVRFYENGRYLSTLRGIVQSGGGNNNNNRLQLTVGARTVQVTTTANTVNTTSRRRFRRGDIVEVTGTWKDLGRGRWNSAFVAQSITLVQDEGAYPGDTNYENGQVTSLTGTVNDAINDDRFRLTLRNGQIITVTTDEDTRIPRNSVVLVRGRWNRDTQRFMADSVRILDNRPNDGNVSRVDFPATILDTRTNNRISVRGDNNRTYEITLTNSLDRNIRRGDRVRIIGTVDRDGLVRADRVVLERDYDSNSSNNDQVDFYGTVTETPVILLRPYYTVRGEDGRDYRVTFNRSTSVRRGDYVHVRGELNNETVTADILERG